MTRCDGALPHDVADAMVARIWRVLEERHGMRSDDPGTWVAGGVRGIGDVNQEPEFRPFGSPPIENALDVLLGKGTWRRPSGWGQVLVTFPARRWSWNSLFQNQVDVTEISWHTDFPYDVAPDQLSGVQVFCLLVDLDPGGGATLVIEGSHRVVRNFVRKAEPATLSTMKRARKALLKSDPWFARVTRAESLDRPEDWIASRGGTVGGVPVAIKELVGKAGDVYLTHPWLLHSISPNCNATPRMMCTQRIGLGR